MTIRYRDGQIVDGILLSRTAATMRVAVDGCEDTLEINRLRGAWVTEDCEPVEVDFAWNRGSGAAEVTEADCLCSPELAERLVHLLQEGYDESIPAAAPAAEIAFAAGRRV